MTTEHPLTSPCEISFYHLTQGDLEKSVAKLLEKVFESGYRSNLVVATDEELDRFNKLLWTFSSLAFLPHGTVDEEHAEAQPLLLSKSPDSRNGAAILATVNAETVPDLGQFKRFLDIFNGHDDDAVTKARERWKHFKTAGHKLTYWKQDEMGRWYQEASSS